MLPARNPLYGWPGLPTDPFLWPSGLVELPVPVVRAGPAGLPFLGGVYLRLIPSAVSRSLLTVTSPRAPWLYCHPYDFDPDEPYWVVPDAGRLGSRLLWLNRRRMQGKVEQLLRDGAGPPLRERAAVLRPQLPTFVPEGWGQVSAVAQASELPTSVAGGRAEVSAVAQAGELPTSVAGGRAEVSAEAQGGGTR